MSGPTSEAAACCCDGKVVGVAAVPAELREAVSVEVLLVAVELPPADLRLFGLNGGMTRFAS